MGRSSAPHDSSGPQPPGDVTPVDVQLIDRITTVTKFGTLVDEIDKMQGFFYEAIELRYMQLHLRAAVMELQEKFDAYMER